MKNIPSYESFRLIEESASIDPPKDWRCEIPGNGSNGGIIMTIPSQLQRRMVETLLKISSRSNADVKEAIAEICGGRPRNEWKEEMYTDSVVLDMGGDRLTVWALGPWIRVGADMAKTPDAKAIVDAKAHANRLIRFLETGEDASQHK